MKLTRNKTYGKRWCSVTLVQEEISVRSICNITGNISLTGKSNDGYTYHLTLTKKEFDDLKEFVARRALPLPVTN